MTRRHRYEGAWCALMAFHLGRLRMTGTTLAQRVGLTQQGAQAILCGRIRPPLKDLPKWAEALGLTPSERDAMVEAAHEAHVPPFIWERLLDLRRQLDSERATKIPPDTAAELKRLRESLAAAHDALVRLEAWGRTGRPLPGNISAVLHKAIAATAVAPTAGK